MTDADRRPRYPTSANPAWWDGGVFLGLVPPTEATWYDERHLDPIRRALDGDWDALADLPQGDAPEAWGFDPGSVGTGGVRAPRPTETRSGVIRLVSRTGTGVLLEELEGWLNTSRYRPVDLTGLGAGDVIEATVEQGRDGRRYLVAVRRLGEGER